MSTHDVTQTLKQKNTQVNKITHEETYIMEDVNQFVELQSKTKHA